MRAFVTILFGLCFSLPISASPDLGGPAATASAAVAGIGSAELQDVLSSPLRRQLRAPPARAFSEDDLKFWADKARQAHRAAPVARGDASRGYDIIIQIGHYPRKKGKTGGQGKLVNEQEAAALVAVGTVQKLSGLSANGAKIRALLVGADDYTPKLKSKIFLALHTDSSGKSCSLGPSVGYQKVGDASGMHGIALALAITLGLDAEKFMRDNYTAALAGYYAYSDFQTERFKGILEMSELTCERQEAKLLTGAATLSANLATAIQFALRDK